MTFHKEITAFLLGLVQGLTEFLPISSSGHLVLAKIFFQVQELDLLFILVLHAGSLLAIISYYKKELICVFKGFYEKPFNLQGPARSFWLMSWALIPSFLTALFFVKLIETYFFSALWVGIGFILTGAVLFRTAGSLKKADSLKEDWASFSFTKAFVIGLAQSLAFLPGFSRSGWTIAAALFLKIPYRQAGFFSFLLAGPAIIGGLVWKVLEMDSPLSTSGAWQVLALAFFSSSLFSYLALKFLIKSLENKWFPFFAFYLWPIGAFVIISRDVL